MLNPDCFSRQWIDRHSQALGCRNPVMLEKAIVAFQLLGHLAETDLPFQFKGGTSLLLRLPIIRRLSIDIDIVTQIDRPSLERILTTLDKLSPFTGHQHDLKRDAALPPKSHYKLFYQSVIEPKQDHILLDVLFEDPVPNTDKVPIQTTFLDPIREVRVSVPTVNAMLGDKLTAFAPDTIGVPLRDKIGESRQTDVIKQLFDTAALFDVADDLNLAADVYTAIHARQCNYRQQPYTILQTLDDSIAACLQLSAHGLRGFVETQQSRQLQDGVSSLQNHLVNHAFRRDEARIAAGKVACVAAWIKNRPMNTPIESLRFDSASVTELRDKQIGPPWPPLDRLKAANPEAFHYWLRASQLYTSKPLL